MTAMSGELIVGSTNVISIPLLQNELDGTPVTGADVDLTLYDEETDAELTGVVWPVAMNHVSGGLYRGVVSVNLNITHNQRVRAVALADDPASTYFATLVEWFVARDKRCC